MSQSRREFLKQTATTATEVTLATGFIALLSKCNHNDMKKSEVAFYRWPRDRSG